MDSSVKQPVLIGIQGGIGSTNERACRFFVQKFGISNFEIKYLITTSAVLQALSRGEIDYGVFAWKSRAGFVKETKDAVKYHRYQKLDEARFQLDHALLYKSSLDIDQTIYIYSHPQALLEHRSFLSARFDRIIYRAERGSAEAAKRLQKGAYPHNSAVIAPVSCAEIYELDVYMGDLPTNKDYYTTMFFVKVQ
jgi:prephenate dehydratase